MYVYIGQPRAKAAPTISSHWFSDTALISALKSPQAQSVIRDMSGDLRAIVGAMETQVGT
jgi:hypothetical protein